MFEKLAKKIYTIFIGGLKNPKGLLPPIQNSKWHGKWWKMNIIAWCLPNPYLYIFMKEHATPSGTVFFYEKDHHIYS